MIDLHSHILPGIDDGAKDLPMSLDMARAYVDQGVKAVACTPHILPGVYNNTGPAIRDAVDMLQKQLSDAGIPLQLLVGADNHIVPDFVRGLRGGHLLSLADTRYVLVEPPHHIAPVRLEDLFFGIILADYVPILTHPERLSWIENKYDMIRNLAERGVWMQITAASVRGIFGRRVKYWADRMLCEGLVHILATDAHNNAGRPPDLQKGRKAVEKLIGPAEAESLVATRPQDVLCNKLSKDCVSIQRPAADNGREGLVPYVEGYSDRGRGSVAQRLRRLFT